MTKRQWWLTGLGSVFALVVFCVLGLFALGAGSLLADGGRPSPSAVASAAGPSSPAPAVTSAAAVPSVAPSPAGSVQPPADPDRFVAELAAIDGALVANRDRALSRGRETCLDIKQAEFTDAQLADRARQRYTGGTVTVSAEQAGRIVAAARQWLCR